MAANEALGDRYDEVQELVNYVLNTSATELTDAVIRGQLGSGELRKRVLGGRYAEVQGVVNDRLGASSKKTYTVKSGDTLSGIAAKYGYEGLILCTLMAGVFLIIMGLFKAGDLIKFVPFPVVTGFTSGIAVIIFLQQVPAAVGVPAPQGVNAVAAAFQTIGQAATPEVFWTVGAVVAVALIMIGAPRLHPKLPGSMIAIVIVIFLVSIFLHRNDVIAVII